METKCFEIAINKVTFLIKQLDFIIPQRFYTVFLSKKNPHGSKYNVGIKLLSTDRAFPEQLSIPKNAAD